MLHVTLETSGSRLSQREEDITHDGGTANTRGCDNVEDAVYIVTKVFLRCEGQESENTHRHKLTDFFGFSFLPCSSPGFLTL